MWNAFAGLIPNLITRPAHLALALPWIFVLGAAALGAGPGRARLTGWLFPRHGAHRLRLDMLNRRDLVDAITAGSTGPVSDRPARLMADPRGAGNGALRCRRIKIVLPTVAALVLAYAFPWPIEIPGSFFGHAGCRSITFWER